MEEGNWWGANEYIDDFETILPERIKSLLGSDKDLKFIN